MLNVEWKSVTKHRGCKIAGIDLQFSSILTQGFQGYSTMNEWVDRWVGVWVGGWMTGWTDGHTAILSRVGESIIRSHLSTRYFISKKTQESCTQIAL